MDSRLRRLPPALVMTGLLAVTGCGAGPTSGGSSEGAGAGSPSGATPSRISASDLAAPGAARGRGGDLPVGTQPHAVTSLAWDGRPVATGPWTSVDVDTGAPFTFTAREMCGQPRVDVLSVTPDGWQAHPSEGQPAVACLPEDETASATEAVRRLFDGPVAVDEAEDGALTLTRAGVELVLTPRR